MDNKKYTKIRVNDVMNFMLANFTNIEGSVLNANDEIGTFSEPTCKYDKKHLRFKLDNGDKIKMDVPNITCFELSKSSRLIVDKSQSIKIIIRMKDSDKESILSLLPKIEF